jgi:para-nitrobenzyl esterase
MHRTMRALALALVASSTALAGLAAVAATTDVVVLTDRGAVQGEAGYAVRRFLGIPYAAPPVGKFRWTPPRTHARWFTTLDATKFGPHCPQFDSVFGTNSTTEDCLYLNVFAPTAAASADGSAFPVMVWFHGGGLIVGQSDDYIPTKLVRRGGVIVVTINYRLGPLGFLAHPALSAESPDHISGSYGFMDQQFALRWVRRNIAAFGGDPHTVTIFGESAGGASVWGHLASPASAGLFHRAIIQSGPGAPPLPSLAEQELHGLDFATALGCDDQSAQCIRAKSLDEVLTTFFYPIAAPVDGKLFPRSPDVAIASGNFNHVPVMNGTNHDEWSFFAGLFYEFGGNPIRWKNYAAVVEEQVGSDLAPRVLDEYPRHRFDSAALAVTAVVTDKSWSCLARMWDQVLASQVPTFAYEFNDADAPQVFLPPASFPYGASHASELRYLFRLRQGGVLNESQKRLSDVMVRYWTQFARTGDPNGPRAPFWPQYDASSDQFQSLVPPSPVTESDFSIDHRCDFWSGLD